MRKITFYNKVENQGATYEGKAWARDFNEIKEIVNENADITTITTAVSADYIDGVLYFRNYLNQIIYQVPVFGLIDTIKLGDLNDVEFINLDDGEAPLYNKILGYFENKKVSLANHNHDLLYAPIGHSNITSGNPHGVSYSNILGTVPFYTKTESDLNYHIKGGAYTEDFLAQTISSRKSLTDTLIIPIGNPVLSPGEYALTMTNNGWGGEPPTGGTVGFLDDLQDVNLTTTIGDLQVLGRNNSEWANVSLTISHVSNLSTELSNRFTKTESDLRYPILSYGMIPAVYLPSFVDDVIEVSSFSNLPTIGENGKIYVTLDTNLTYRWSGSVYTEISKSLALGETDSTAYRGDRGKTAYEHSLIISGNPHGVSYSNITETAPFYTKTESDLRYHPLYGSNLIDFSAKKLKSETLIVPTNGTPELSVGEYALLMTNNGWSGEEPSGGVTGYLGDLNDVSLSSPVVNQFLFHNGTSWINSYLTSLLVTTALGFTPYSSSNPSGFISAITGTMVQTVLTGEITSHYHDGRYYTETEINNYFSGTTAITGYSKSNWDTAFSQTRQWDGGNTGLVAATGRTSLGLGTAALNNTGDFLAYNANAVSATKLYIARNIWGQSFDGTANISGAITGATDITASGRVQSGTLLIPTGNPNLSAGEWAIVMTNNGFGGEAPEGGIVGYLNDLIDVSISSPLINQFLYFNGSTWTNSYLNSSQIINALGFTPYNATNPSNYISAITGSMVNTALGYTPYNSSNPSGYISGITSLMVTNALGYTPWSSNAGNHPTTLSGYGISSSDTMFDGKYSAGDHNHTSINGIGIGAIEGGDTKVIIPSGFNFKLKSGDAAHHLYLGYSGGLNYDGQPILHTGNFTSYADAAGAAATVQGNLNTHINNNGTSVHGLGTASLKSDTYFALLAGSTSQAFNVSSLTMNGALSGATTGLFTGTLIIRTDPTYYDQLVLQAVTTNAGAWTLGQGVSGFNGLVFREQGVADWFKIAKTTGAATFASTVSGTSAFFPTSVYTDWLKPYAGNLLTILGGGANILHINGLVGIGYTDRTEKLAVNGSGYFNTTLKIGSTWDFNTNGIFYWGGSAQGLLTWDTGWAAVRAASGNYLTLGTSTYTSAIRVASNGTVAINYTTDQPYQFALNGNFYAASYIESASYLKGTSVKIGSSWEAIPNGSNGLDLKYGTGVVANFDTGGALSIPTLILSGHTLTIE